MSNYINLILLISLILNLIFFCLSYLFLSKRGGFTYLKANILNLINLTKTNHQLNFVSVYWQHKTSQFQVLSKHNDLGTIFLGDSLTDEGEWGELLEDLTIKNRGIRGDTTEKMINRLNDIIQCQPKKLFLMVGINDLINERKSIKNILVTYKLILTEFHQKTAKTEVFIQSILPVNNQITRYFQDNNTILKLNLDLKYLAEEFNYQYIELFSHFSDSDNQLNSQYTLDGLHLNGKGYLVWKEAIKQYTITHKL